MFESTYTDTSQQSVFKPFLVLIGSVLLILYLIIAFNTQNMWWFMSNLEEVKPTHIIIRDQGRELVYRPGDKEYETLTPVIRQAIASVNNTGFVEVGVSENTEQEYLTRFTVLEVYYDETLQFGTNMRTGNTRALLFPITGRHAATGLFFRGDGQEWLFGGLQMGETQLFYQTLEQLGYKATVYNPNESTSSNQENNGG